MSSVRFVGSYREWSCPSCGCLMTGLRVPDADARQCADCVVPPDAPSGELLATSADEWLRLAVGLLKKGETGPALAAIQCAERALKKLVRA